MAAGNGYSMLLKQDGSMWVAGKNRRGQLGVGSIVREKKFVRVSFSGGQSISVGFGAHSMVLKQDNSVWATGRNDVGQLGDGSIVDKNSFIRVGVYFTFSVN